MADNLFALPPEVILWCLMLAQPLNNIGPRPSHLKIPRGPKMARASLRRRAIDGSFEVKLRKCGRRLFAVLRLSGPLMARRDPPLDGPFRRAKNGPSQMRKPDWAFSIVGSLLGTVSHLKSALFHGICPARFTSALKLFFSPGPGLGAPLSSRACFKKNSPLHICPSKILMTFFSHHLFLRFPSLAHVTDNPAFPAPEPAEF